MKKGDPEPLAPPVLVRGQITFSLPALRAMLARRPWRLFAVSLWVEAADAK